MNILDYRLPKNHFEKINPGVFGQKPGTPPEHPRHPPEYPAPIEIPHPTEIPSPVPGDAPTEFPGPEENPTPEIEPPREQGSVSARRLSAAATAPGALPIRVQQIRSQRTTLIRFIRSANRVIR